MTVAVRYHARVPASTGGPDIQPPAPDGSATSGLYRFLSLEDEWGLVNVIVRPAVGERCSEPVRRAPMLVVDGCLQREGMVISVLADEVRCFAPSAAEQPAAAIDGVGTGLQSLAHNFR